MSDATRVILNLAAEVSPPENGILSRTVFQDEHVKAVVFGFDSGQSLSEHTSSRPAILHLLSGRARITLGAEQVDAQAGTWIHMPPKLPHAVQAEEPTVMLLLLLRGPATSTSGS
jgi:quercetin dioxygenase-like cupin family protein